MREIKFRAWVKSEDKLYPVAKWSRSGWIAVPVQLSEDDWRLEQRPLEDTVLMQFTELKDKNGKEIYEGDILQFSDKWELNKTNMLLMALSGKTVKERQEWLDAIPYCQQEVKMPDCYTSLSKSDLQQYWEVIGNIYENPELLK